MRTWATVGLLTLGWALLIGGFLLGGAFGMQAERKEIVRWLRRTGAGHRFEAEAIEQLEHRR